MLAPAPHLASHASLATAPLELLSTVKKDGMPEKAQEVAAMLRKARFSTFYDEKGAIGRRYRRQDEVGTPFCITIDGDSLSDDVVTVRHRDSMEQDKVKISELATFLIEAKGNWKRPERKE